MPLSLGTATSAASTGSFRPMCTVLGGQTAWIADNIGAGVHFNPFVSDQRGRAVKYGVLALDSLLLDLATWRRLYISGRMHKPVRSSSLLRCNLC